MILHCITLPQRKENLKSEIERLGIEAVYWDATVLYNSINAIAMSHKKIIKWAKENNISEVCIAEDDIVFTSINSYKYFLANKPADYDIYLGGNYSGVKMPDGTLYGFTGFTIYCCHSRYYDKFLSTPINKNIDAAQRGMGKFIACEPLIAKQRNGYSFHRKKEVNDDSYLAGRNFLLD